MAFLQDSTSTSVKICGLMDEECIDVAIGSGADAIGFVFVPNSPRQISRELADRLTTQLPQEVLAVAVVQNHDSLSDFNDWNGWLQLCGDEDERIVESSPCPVIRAFKWNQESLLRWDACPHAQALLVDGSSGGMGKEFDITELTKLLPSLSTPVIIAGGLTPSNVSEIINAAKPAGVDVSSGVESERGVKDPSKICAFLNAVKCQH